MSYLYGPMNRRRPTQGVRPQTGPTLEDYNNLAHAYTELQTRFEAQSKELAAKTNEIAIKEEALQRQGADLKQAEVDFLWARAALEQAQKELGEAKESGWQERFLALQTEVEGLRRRWEQRFVDETEEARRVILRDMLPVADHLELALQHANTTDSQGLAAFVANIGSTLRAFLDTMRRYGVERQDVLGKLFDPTIHEAVGQAVSAEAPEGYIMHVALSGYMDGDKLLRPARVVVSMGNGK